MKLVKEDDKLFHFETPDGSFKVVKKGLSKNAMDKIQKIKSMCAGGSVQKFDDGGKVRPADPDKAKDFVSGYAPTSADKAVTNAVQHPIQTVASAFGFSHGTPDGTVGDQTQYDAPLVGADAATAEINPGQQEIVPDRSPASAAQEPQDDSIAGKVGNFIGDKVIGGAVRGAGQLYNGLKNDLAPIGKFTQGVEKGLGAGEDSQPAPQADPNAQPPKSPAEQLAEYEALQKTGKPPAPGNPNYEQKLNDYLSDYAKNSNAVAQQQVLAGQQNADRVGKFLDDGAKYLQTHQEEQQKLADQNAQLSRDVANSKIDPNHFVNDMGAGSKIATGIGILFSGMGAGAHGTNLALSVLQDQVNKDIEAQKANLGNKQNLLTQNLRMYGDKNTAFAATQAQRYAMLQGQIMQQAYKDGSAGALEQAKMANDMLGAKMIPLQAQISQFTAKQRMLDDPSLDPMTRALLMGGGKNAKALMDQQKQKIATQKTMSLYDQAAEDAKNPLRMLPGMKSPAQGAADLIGMGKTHDITKIRDPKMNHELYDAAFKPSFIGNLTGANDKRRLNYFNTLNTETPLVPSQSSDSEGEE